MGAGPSGRGHTEGGASVEVGLTWGRGHRGMGLAWGRGQRGMGLARGRAECSPPPHSGEAVPVTQGRSPGVASAPWPPAAEHVI